MTGIWDIEDDPEYGAWLAAIRERHPRVPMDAEMSKMAPGSSTACRVVFMADGGEDSLRLGVRLNTGDEFWKPVPGSFEAMVAATVADGTTVRDGKWRSAAEIFPAAQAAHGPAVRLEAHSSHVGGGTHAVMGDGTLVEIDFS
jgi:hypothetical protein